MGVDINKARALGMEFPLFESALPQCGTSGANLNLGPQYKYQTPGGKLKKEEWFRFLFEQP